jgi:hypothetical protein
VNLCGESTAGPSEIRSANVAGAHATRLGEGRDCNTNPSLAGTNAAFASTSDLPRHESLGPFALMNAAFMTTNAAFALTSQVTCLQLKSLLTRQ